MMEMLCGLDGLSMMNGMPTSWWKADLRIGGLTMGRYIDADKMIYEIRHNLWDWSCVDDIRTSLVLKQTITDIENQPSEDVAPIIHAHWTRKRTLSHDGELYCSKCEWTPEVLGGTTLGDLQLADVYYCPHCGAKMD